MVTNTSTELARTKLVAIGQTRIGTDLAVFERTTRLCDVGIVVAFLFKGENYTFNLRLNYKIGFELARTSSFRMRKCIEELVVTLKKSKPNPKQIIRLLVRLA